MANLQQAPAIKYNGEKYVDSKKWGKAIRTHELESAIMCGLGDRDMAQLKIMLFLTGNAEGFRVAEKTIMSRCNISESGYKTARKKLIEKGWIKLVPGEEIIVNYKAIYASAKGQSENTPSNDNKNTEGYSENTSQGYSENTPLGYSENTHNNIINTIKEQDKRGEDETSLASLGLISSSYWEVPGREEKPFSELTKSEQIEKFKREYGF